MGSKDLSCIYYKSGVYGTVGKKLVHNTERLDMDYKTKEKLMYLLKFMDYNIDDLVYNVVNDSKDDPHYSAVTASNLLKCYIEVMDYLGEELPYRDMRSYFEYNRFDIKDFENFEKSRLNETTYYNGIIY